jgi:hypothetical protein
MKKIAFLFLTLNDVNFPKIWDEYFKGHENQYNIYIHPKYPDQVTWNKDKIIGNLKETAWGFITRAYLELFKEALKDKDNFKFITLSETCLPIQSFDRLYKTLTKDNDSWVKLMKITKYKFNEVLKKTPGNFIHHYARFCLSRHHVKKVLINKSKLDFFHNMHIGDEYFLSVLYPLRHFKDKEIIFDDWEYTDSLKESIKNKIKELFEEQEKNNNTENNKEIEKLRDEIKHISGHPKTIINVEEDLDKIKKCDAFFYRKFSKKSNIEEYWGEIIKYHNKN